jgi:hypothetical protein
MTDPRIAALALPIHDLLDGAGACGGNGVHLPWDYIEKVSAAILAALDGWTLVRSTPASVQLDEIEARWKAEVAASNARIAALMDGSEISRLRKIEEAAEALIVVYPPDWIETKGSPALRALQEAVHG